MSNTNEISPYLIVILTEMCKRVGFDHGDSWEYFKQDTWYYDHTWSKEEQEDFTKWLTDYIHDNRTVRLDLTNCRTKSKKCCRRAAEEFVWGYGWKVESDNESH